MVPQFFRHNYACLIVLKTHTNILGKVRIYMSVALVILNLKCADEYNSLFFHSTTHAPTFVPIPIGHIVTTKS